MGFIFGLLGFVFALSAMEKIRRLEERLKEEAWGLKETHESDLEAIGIAPPLKASSYSYRGVSPMTLRIYPRFASRLVMCAAILVQYDEWTVGLGDELCGGAQGLRGEENGK